MALTTVCQFDTDPNSARKGKIVLFGQESVNLSPDYWTMYVKITDPTGTVIHTPPAFSALGDYNVTALTQTIWSDIVIPTDSNGNYLSGNYLIEIWKRFVSDALPAAVKIANETYNFCPHNTPLNTLNSRLSFSQTLSCVTGLLTGNDLTDYTALAFTRTSRLLTIDPPAIDGRANVTSSTNTVSITVTYTNVSYGILYNITYTYSPQVSALDATTSIITQAGVINYVNYAVTCDSSICATVECLGTYFTDLEAKACAKGGWSRLTAAEQGNFTYVSAMINLASMSLACGNVTNYELYLNKAKAILNDCNCGCAECSDDPKPFVPTT